MGDEGSCVVCGTADVNLGGVRSADCLARADEEVRRNVRRLRKLTSRSDGRGASRRHTLKLRNGQLMAGILRHRTTA